MIDLDDPTMKKVDGVSVPNLDQEEVERIGARQTKISEIFRTYQERSQSGRGLHIIGRGSVSKGFRRDCVEVYSTGRFMICTGDVMLDLPLLDCSEALGYLEEDMAPASTIVLEEKGETLTDEQILRMAENARNSHKFNSLYAGQINGHPSQSEADHALLAMFCYYTDSNEQVRRLFRASALGQREKAHRGDYLNRSLAQVRARQAIERVPMVDFSRLMRPIYSPPPPPPSTPPPVPGGSPSLAPPPIPWPPGLLGEVGHYIYSTSKRPIREIALGSAIGFMSAICGRQYNISASGLNHYTINMAGTGVGKEDGSKGISRLVAAILPFQPSVENFIGPSAFASGQAIRRLFDKRKCMLAQLGEVGQTFKQWFDPRAPASVIGIRKELLDIFGKSGHQDYLGASVYADHEKNALRVLAPCLSILGDSTPEKFFSSLDADSVADGFLPRFWIFHAEGDRQYGQKVAFQPPPEWLVLKLTRLVQTVTAMEGNNIFIHVGQALDAESISDEFDRYCTDKINAAHDEVTKQLWTRTHFKALKLAGLMAVGVNFEMPVVTKDLINLTIEMAVKDTEYMVSKFARGDVGQGDHKQEAEIRKAVDKYSTLTDKQKRDNNVPEKALPYPKMVPFAYLKKNLSLKTAFKNDRRGSAMALKLALESMVQAGTLELISPRQMVQYGIEVISNMYKKGESW